MQHEPCPRPRDPCCRGTSPGPACRAPASTLSADGRPAGTPGATVGRLNAASLAALADLEVATTLGEGLAAVDKVYGGFGDDQLYGDELYDFSGTAGGADLLYGGDGRDSLYGQAGNHTLRGEASDDYLWGGPGNDTLIGGTGADEHLFYVDSDTFPGKDVITDFVKGEDEVYFGASLGDRHPQGFSDLDTNDNDVLDNQDELVDIASASYGGSSRTSTIIDVSAGTGGPDQLVVFGVTGMTSGDFSSYY